MFTKIVVAIDGSVASERSLAVAVDLAAHYQADLIAIGVAEIPEVVAMMGEVDELRENAEQHFRQIGEAAVQYARTKGVALRSVVVRGHPADAVVRFAEGENADLLVVGNHGHSRIIRFFLGSTTTRVSEHSPCSVMIVK